MASDEIIQKESAAHLVSQLFLALWDVSCEAYGNSAVWSDYDERLLMSFWLRRMLSWKKGEEGGKWQGQQNSAHLEDISATLRVLDA